MIKQMETTEQWIRSIRDGNEQVIGLLYDQFRTPFLHWSKHHYNLEEEDLIDVFQDAVIIFYQKIAEERLTSIESSIKTYLFGIAKYLIFRKLKDKKRSPVEVDNIPDLEVDPIYFQKEEESERQVFLQNAINQLGPSCKQIVDFFYFYNYSLDAIANRMRYKNTETVKSQKQRCMRQLKKILESAKGNYE
ncbi:MAG: sigma-70 family RNA polymerase sigma factor [Bacteroidota bacterium]